MSKRTIFHLLSMLSFTSCVVSAPITETKNTSNPRNDVNNNNTFNPAINILPTAPSTGPKPQNQKPIIQQFTSNPTNINFAENDKITFSVVAVDPDKDPLSYHWSTTKGILSSTAGVITIWSPQKSDLTLEPSIATDTVTVSDGAEITSSQINIQIQAGRAVIYEGSLSAPNSNAQPSALPASFPTIEPTSSPSPGVLPSPPIASTAPDQTASPSAVQSVSPGSSSSSTITPSISPTTVPSSNPVATPTPLPIPQTLSNRWGMSFKKIPHGSFSMGQEGITNAGPVHQVTLTSDFYIQTTEVTQHQWFEIMGTWPGESPNQNYGSGDNYPMYFVSWEDIQAFLLILNSRGEGTYRLPTEAEWEYAARAGTTGDYSCQTQTGTCPGDFAWLPENAGNSSHPVGTKNANPWGLFDMDGNVLELVQDWYGLYSQQVQTNPTGPTGGTQRVARLGSWGHPAGAARRYGITPTNRFGDMGFRLVRNID